MAETSVWREGGCHCGAVRFRVRIHGHELLDCNCSICRQKGILHLIVSRQDFALLRGDDALATYTFGTHVAKHHFCRVCGVHPFYVPRSHPDAIDVNARCLDGDAPLAEFTVKTFDGRRWDEVVHTIR